MSHQDLTQQLKSFQISSEEDRVAHALSKTHLEPTSNNSIFSIPKPPQANSVTTTETTNQPPEQRSPTLLQQHNEEANGEDWKANVSWSYNKKGTLDNNDNVGWGTGPPSYTSITQGTYFGFNSIITPSHVIIDNEPTQLRNTQAFNCFKNKPVSFTSAMHNTDSSSMQQ